MNSVTMDRNVECIKWWLMIMNADGWWLMVMNVGKWCSEEDGRVLVSDSGSEYQWAVISLKNSDDEWNSLMNTLDAVTELLKKKLW